MASGSNQFFEDEEDIARSSHEAASNASRKAASSRDKAQKSAASSGKTAGTRGGHGAKDAVPASRSATAAKHKRRPPSFVLVVAIAIVALVLGFALGYFVALAQISAQIDALYAGLDTGSATSSASADSSTMSVNEQAGLPEGHPDLSSVYHDGSVDEDALAAAIAQISAENDQASSNQ